jgi:hypothetical protein
VRHEDNGVDEAAWLASNQLYEMLAFVQDTISDRKRRLFAAACCGRVSRLMADPRSQQAIEVAQRYADDRTTEEERLLAEEAAFDAHIRVRESRFAPDPLVVWSRQAELLTHAAALALAHGTYYAEDAADYARWALAAGAGGWPAEQEEEAAQCRLLRDLVGPLPFRRLRVEPAWRVYNDGAAVQLARWVYDAQAFEDLPILADALEDAGCSNAVILEHCRRPGEHTRGCWVVDLVLEMK